MCGPEGEIKMKHSALLAILVAGSLLAGCKPKPTETPRAGVPAQAEADYRPPTECDLRAQSYGESECIANLSGMPDDATLAGLVLAEMGRGLYERSSHTDGGGRCWWDNTVQVEYKGRKQRLTVSCPIPDSVTIQ